MEQKHLNVISSEHPFPDFADWWNMGTDFLGFMSEAMVSEWALLAGGGSDAAAWAQVGAGNGRFQPIITYTAQYIQTVFSREARATLVSDFATKQFVTPIQSGEFDALSYAFYRAAFELIEQHSDQYAHSVKRERRLFTKRVGKLFFQRLHQHLNLNLPTGLDDGQDFAQLKSNIHAVGTFLNKQGYLRDHFDFRFSLKETHAGKSIAQSDSAFLDNLKRDGIGYAIYEMGYPAILPSAVYLYHILGEAQHHSSRIIEELFALVGYEARETDDFDPTDYPPDRVIELWEIKKIT